MKSEESAAELQMGELLKEGEDIVDDNYLKTQDARRILDAGYKLKEKCKELRTSRDKAITRRDTAEKELRKERDGRVSEEVLSQLMIKAFKFGQKKDAAEYDSIKLWVADEIQNKLKKPEKNANKK